MPVGCMHTRPVLPSGFPNEARSRHALTYLTLVCAAEGIDSAVIKTMLSTYHREHCKPGVATHSLHIKHSTIRKLCVITH